MPNRSLTPALTAQREPVGARLAAFALALLLGLQPMSTDVYLPALPMLTRDLAAPMGAVQLTMSALILAFGIAQMFWGPLADHLGRKPVLLMGLSLFTIASIGCATSADIQALVIWRACQGAALAAAVVCARAIVRDLYEPVQGAQVMALALTGLGVLALTGPMAGGVAAAQWGWRAPLVLVAAVGVSTLLFVTLRLPETLPGARRSVFRWMPLLRQWQAIACHPVFIVWATLVACTYGGLFTILAASSFAYIDVLHLSPAGYGLAMAAGSGSYIIGTLVCRRWIRQFGMAGAVARGAWFTLLGGLSMLALLAAGVQAVWAVLVPQCIYLFGHGLHQPCGQAGVAGPFPQAAGAASALAGLLLALVAFVIGRWLGATLDGTLQPLAQTLAFWAVLTAATALLWVPRVVK